MSGIISARAWGKVWAYRSTFLLGLLNTVETAFFAILLSLALGVIFGLMATSGKKVLQIISRVYVEIMQNTPILLPFAVFPDGLEIPANQRVIHGEVHAEDHAEYADFASAVFLLLCAGFFRSQYRNPADRYRCTGRIHRSLYGRGGARGHRGRP